MAAGGGSVTAMDIPALNSGFAADGYSVFPCISSCIYIGAIAAGGFSVTAINIPGNSGFIADGYCIFIGVSGWLYINPIAAGSVSGTAINVNTGIGILTDYYCVFVGVGSCSIFSVVRVVSGSRRVSTTAINTGIRCGGGTNNSITADGYFILVGVGNCSCSCVGIIIVDVSVSDSVSDAAINTGIRCGGGTNNSVTADDYFIFVGVGSCIGSMSWRRIVVSVWISIRFTAINILPDSNTFTDGYRIIIGFCADNTCCAIFNVSKSVAAINIPANRSSTISTSDDYLITVGRHVGSMYCIPIGRRVTNYGIGIVTAINISANRSAVNGYRIIVGAGSCLNIYCARVVVSKSVTGNAIVTAINIPANSRTVNSYRIIVGAGGYFKVYWVPGIFIVNVSCSIIISANNVSVNSSPIADSYFIFIGADSNPGISVKLIKVLVIVAAVKIIHLRFGPGHFHGISGSRSRTSGSIMPVNRNTISICPDIPFSGFKVQDGNVFVSRIGVITIIVYPGHTSCRRKTAPAWIARNRNSYRIGSFRYIRTH